MYGEKKLSFMNKLYHVATVMLNDNSNITTSLNGYVNNTVIKFLIYFNSHKRVVSNSFHIFIQNRGAYKLI